MKNKTLLLILSVMFWSKNIFAHDLAIYNAKLYVGPNQNPIENATVVIKDGVITEVSQSLPKGGMVKIDAKGRSVTAGLWNSHVHLTDTDLKTNPQRALTDMLLKFGFTSVVDTGSDLHSTLSLVRSIDEGIINGPSILIANGSFVYTDGTPSYLPNIQLPEIGLPSEAAPAVDKVLQAGAHGIKIFSGSFMSPRETIHLPPDVIAAIVKAAHKKNAFVIAHPTDKIGLENAIFNGVDILAHTAPPVGELSDKTVQAMIKNQVALIPTLMLWHWELSRHELPDTHIQATQNLAVNQLKSVHKAGGTILFGTDVGYMTNYDPSDEYHLMALSGMNFNAILKSLTSNPAKRFSAHSGLVEIGEPGDLVIYKADPSIDMSFESIDMTIKGGAIVFETTSQ